MRTIPHDKANHLIAGQIVAAPGLVLAPWPEAAMIGAACCAAAAVLREVYNRQRGGAFDLADIAWTLAGGAALLAVAAAVR
jgi:hypothetical protein